MTFMRPVSHGALRLARYSTLPLSTMPLVCAMVVNRDALVPASAEAVDITRSPDAHGGQSVRGPQILKCGNPWKFEIIGLASRKIGK